MRLQTLSLVAHSLLSLIGYVHAAPQPPAASPTQQPTQGVLLYQFPNGTWINQLVVRPNGMLLMSFHDRPEIHALDPYTLDAKPQLVHRFANGSGILAMTEYMPDRFAVLVTPPNKGPQDADSPLLWTIRLDNLSGGAKVDYTGYVQEGETFISLARMNGTTLLAANVNGAIHRIDIPTGRSAAIVTDPTMTPGISGIRYQAPLIYFVNQDQGLFARIQIDPETVEAIAPVEVIARRVTGVSDLALATWTEHEAYLANYEQGQIMKVDENAAVSVAVNGWRAPTSLQFGRSPDLDTRTLYFVTAGSADTAGKVVAVQV